MEQRMEKMEQDMDIMMSTHIKMVNQQKNAKMFSQGFSQGGFIPNEDTSKLLRNMKVEESGLKPLIIQREQLREKKAMAHEMFNNEDDEEENSHIDQLLSEQKNYISDRINQKYVK